MLARTTNRFVPFGSNNFGARSLPAYHAALARHEATIQAGIAAQANSESVALDRRARRAEQRARAHEARKTEVRSGFLAALETLSIAEQLEQLANDQMYPCEFYPTRLAGAATVSVIHALPVATQLMLAQKMLDQRRGPWAGCKRRLLASLKGSDTALPWNRQPWFRRS